MPVPCVGFPKGILAFKRVKRRIFEKRRTLMVLSNCIQGRFGAQAIDRTITG